LAGSKEKWFKSNWTPRLYESLQKYMKTLCIDWCASQSSTSGVFPSKKWPGFQNGRYPADLEGSAGVNFRVLARNWWDVNHISNVTRPWFLTYFYRGVRIEFL